MKILKTSIFKLLFIALICSNLGYVTSGFHGWTSLIKDVPYILIVRCKESPRPTYTSGGWNVRNPIGFGPMGGVTLSDVEVVLSIKGDDITVGAPVILLSELRPYQGGNYLLFADQFDGTNCYALDRYRVVSLGDSFDTNVVTGTNIEEKVKSLFRYKLGTLNEEIGRAQEEKVRLEGGVESLVHQDSPDNAHLSNSVDLFKVVIDSRSGNYAAVSEDGHVIALKKKIGTTIWTHDLFAKYGTNVPMFSNGKIESLQFIENQIVINVGKEYVYFNPKTGLIARRESR